MSEFDSKRQQAVDLVDSWLADESGYDEATWPEIRSAICREPDKISLDRERYQAALRRIRDAENSDSIGCLHDCCLIAGDALGIPEPEPTQTWQEKYYAVPASELKDASDEACIEHGLTKWRGALPENLKPYGMTFYDHLVSGDDYRLVFGTSSCALCVKYHPVCKNCPIVKSGQLSCYDNDSPYEVPNNPRPMIACLERTLAWIQQQEKEKEKEKPKPEPTQLERLRKRILENRAAWWGIAPRSRCNGHDTYDIVLHEIDRIAGSTPSEPDPTAMEKLRSNVLQLKQLVSDIPERVAAYENVLTYIASAIAKETTDGNSHE